MKNILICLFVFGLTLSAPAETRVLCTTFPIYQIARNVVAGHEDIAVDLMLPASLGCPHDYALTPRDMMKLARADVLIVNGHGMEEFLGAPVTKANPDLHILDSSTRITDLLAFESDPNTAPYEWAGWFDLKPGRYTWTFAKVDGTYADPTMMMVILLTAASDKPDIASLTKTATPYFDQTPEDHGPGDALAPSPVLYRLQLDETSDVTRFEIMIDQAGAYVFFTEHMPFEFEADEHFFKDADGNDIEPLAQQPEAKAGPGHGHGQSHKHGHHHHKGINPHLWVSPRMSAEIAHSIARELGVLIPAASEGLARNADTYAERMTLLLEELRVGVGTLPNRRIIQPHGIFDYLARDIGLEIIATTQPHGAEPSASEMLRLVGLIRENGVGAVFTEPQYSPRVGQTLAAETGIPSAMLDPAAAGPEGASLDYYETVMRANLATLRAALGGHE
ncbi:MAG TPA: metal ABC transporter substrate-binding protein [Kiritimatiellia bacterium]|nr:metal ABC transporter substrate-binding protein [Kiritimatiellia bacterium]